MLDVSDRESLFAMHNAALAAGAEEVDVDVLVSCAMSALRQSSYDNAQAILEAAMLVDPDHAQVWSLIGMVAERQGRDHDARTAYETALGLDEDDPVTAMALAGLYARCGLGAQAGGLCHWLLGEADDAPEIRARAAALIKTLEGNA